MNSLVSKLLTAPVDATDNLLELELDLYSRSFNELNFDSNSLLFHSSILSFIPPSLRTILPR